MCARPLPAGSRKKIAVDSKKTEIKTIPIESSAAKKLGKPRSFEMSFAQWAALPPAPTQRDTEKHWKERAHKYLSILREAHRTVTIAELPDGTRYKIDAHTRHYGWTNNLTNAKPDKLTVIVHYVNSLDDINSEYGTFDSAGQTKDAGDQLFSAYKQFNIECQSPFLKNCRGVVSALKEAAKVVGQLYDIPGAPADLRKISVATCVEFFQDQLRALDTLMPTKARFSGPPTAAFLLAHFKYSELDKHVSDVLEIFKLHQEDAGVKAGKRHDAVYAITNTMLSKAKGGETEGGGEGARNIRVAKILGAVENFIFNGRRVGWQNDPRVDMENYLLDERALLSLKGGRKPSAKVSHKKRLTR